MSAIDADPEIVTDADVRANDTVAKARREFSQNGFSRIVDRGRCLFGRFCVS
jgi:hypothetical protein